MRKIVYTCDFCGREAEGGLLDPPDGWTESATDSNLHVCNGHTIVEDTP